MVGHSATLSVDMKGYVAQQLLKQTSEAMPRCSSLEKVGQSEIDNTPVTVSWHVVRLLKASRAWQQRWCSPVKPE